MSAPGIEHGRTVGIRIVHLQELLCFNTEWCKVVFETKLMDSQTPPGHCKEEPRESIMFGPWSKIGLWIVTFKASFCRSGGWWGWATPLFYDTFISRVFICPSMSGMVDQLVHFVMRIVVQGTSLQLSVHLVYCFHQELQFVSLARLEFFTPLSIHITQNRLLCCNKWRRVCFFCCPIAEAAIPFEFHPPSRSSLPGCPVALLLLHGNLAGITQ